MHNEESCERGELRDFDVRAMADRGLRVVQLNAGSLLEPGWEQRRHEIVAWLERLDPDVVCLQEIWESERSQNTAGRVVAQLRTAQWHWVFGGGRFRSTLLADPTVVFGSAILSRWPIEDHRHWLLPLAADPDEVVSGMRGIKQAAERDAARQPARSSGQPPPLSGS